MTKISMRRSLAAAVVLIGMLGLVLALPGCDPPKFASEADVLAVLNQPRTAAEQVAFADEGRRMFLRHSCQQCHVVAGTPRGAPRLADLYTTQTVLIDGSTIDRDRSYVIRSILRSNEQVVAGYPQQMTSYRHIPADEVAALVAYLERYSPWPGADEPDGGEIIEQDEQDSPADGLPKSQE